MTILLAALSLLIIGLAVALAATLAKLQRQLAVLAARLDTLPPLPEGGPRPVIAIEILNPFELAVRESPFAGPAAKLAPRIIERIVYTRAADQIAEQLRAQGVEAQVVAHVA